MKYLEKYDCFIDDDCVVYHKYGVRQCDDRLAYFREYNRNRNK